MELKQYPVALASFREALRIRREVLGYKHPLVVRLLNNIGCALFEMDDLAASKAVFDDALRIQRKLMKLNKGTGLENDSGATERTFQVDPKDTHHMLLSIALTLCNLGSIHLRWGEFDESLVFFEEALIVSSH